MVHNIRQWFACMTCAVTLLGGAGSAVGGAPGADDVTTILDAERFPDESWAKLLQQGQSEAAVEAFVQTLRTGPDRFVPQASVVMLYRQWLGREFGQMGGHQLDPDDVVRGRYVGVYGIEHTFRDEIDWRTNPSKGAKRTGEWTWQFNRHYQWIHLADAYAATGDEKYARAWEKELRSWVAQCPPPEGDDRRTAFAWRTIEAGIRAGWTWPYAFHIFSRSEHVSDEALWLFVRAMHAHGRYLSEHHGSKNWLTMETNGLAHVGLMFPELAGAAEFAATAGQRIMAMATKQFYADGMHYELAPSYGLLSIISLYAPTKLAQVRGPALSGSGGVDGWQVDAVLGELAKATRALGRLADPHGVEPPIHDSPSTDITGVYRDVVLEGEPGPTPWTAGESALLPWGGFAVLRREGRYAVLDAGPWGAGHQHADALQLLLFAHDRWLLIDPGKPQYNQSKMTRHLRSSAAHNVVLMDGRNHQPSPKRAVIRKPMAMALVNAGSVQLAAAKRKAMVDADGDTKAGFQHERVVLDLPGELGLLVVDRLWPSAATEPHSWEFLWHVAADSVDADAARGPIASYDNGAALAVQAVSTVDVAWQLSAGETEPMHRGWRSVGESNEPAATPVLRLISADHAGPIVTTTWLRPLAELPDADAELGMPEAATDEITVMLTTAEGHGEFRFLGGEQIERVVYRLATGEAESLDVPTHAH